MILMYAPYSEKIASRRASKIPAKIVETIEVLRLELKSGIGIYRDNKDDTDMLSTWNQATNSFRDDTIHQLPTKDRILNYDEYFDRDYIFGFKDIEQYKKWVFDPSWRKNLKKYNVVLSTYEVPKEFVKFGQKQLIFLKEKAKLIKQVSPYQHF